MEHSIFKKAKLAAAIALVSSTTLMTGCLFEGDEAKSVTTAEVGNNSEHVQTPVGTVMGTVVDTNGNPVKGAKIYVGGRAVTTGAGGNYELRNVPVSNLTVTDKGNFVGGDIRLTIVPPAGFLGAIVTVEPTAVIDNGRSDQGTTDETNTGSTNYFIDGFTAVAGDAVLPAIGTGGATVTGVLRDADTEAPIANQTINLELQDVNGSPHTNGGGNAISYTSVSYPATTDANGAFSIAGVPNDSDLNFIVGGYAVTGVDANNFGATGVTTDDEVETVHVGNVYASVITNADDARPYVTSIEEVATNGSRAKLHDDTTNVLTVHFSEQLQAAMIDANSVIVRDLDAGAYLNVTTAVAADARSMTLTADSNFVAGNRLDIYLLKVDFRDTSSNLLDEDSNVAANDISYDFDNVNGNSDYVKLQVEVYRELNINAAVVTNLTQLTTDDSPLRLANDLDNASSAFADVDMALALNGVQQLNSADDDDSASGIDTKERLANLVVALDKAGIVDASSIIQLNEDGTPDTSNLGLNSNFFVDVARVSFTPSNASTYRYWIQRNGAAVTTNIDIDEQSSPDAKTTNTASNFTTIANNQGYGTIEPATGSEYADFVATDIAFLISAVQPGDMLYIQSMDDFGNEGSTTSIALADNVPVTTGLQDSYGEQDLTSTSTVFGEQYGNGGELANPDAQSLIGTPLLNINAGMLADQDIYTDATPSLDDLYESNETNTTTGDFYIDPALEIYDATAYVAWSADMSRTIAVSFTEDLAWVAPLAADSSKPAVGSEPVDTASAALTNWTIMNDITIASDTDVVNADLAAFSVNNIFTLGNTDGQTAKVIDFSDLVADSAGNVSTAAANAKVVINDALPPVMTRAVYTGNALTLTFNEPVKVSTDTAIPVVTLGGVNIFLDEDTIAAHNALAAASRTTLTIPFTTDNADDMLPLNRAALFGLAQYDEPDVSLAGATVGFHGSLSFVNVQDDFGNTWANDAANLTAPTFAAFDNLGAMQITAQPVATAIANGVNTITLTYTFSHAIDLDAMLGNAFGTNQTALNAADVLTIMTYTGAATVDNGAATNGTLSNNGKTLTVTVAMSAGTFATTETLGFSAAVPSLWDSVDAVAVPVLTVQ
ncbi:carboxypeptidase-like regulatory domain-containing protein [Thalassolituus sp. C2-1]|uniref:carboxypeptidase-like regulatory domain-containing protein n=1 Tax=Venatorbacter sp. C2-1 TaxID=2597518 RepID=UPI00119437F1|nr:carboxypeptidase-like regulatory domain-containing protein [Thalassolituus sp. C2-1]TVV44490.1 carboxypeptidase regulatory-like domain-containing protein [Thalassolituus sp. C2-1]